jgi:clan AA aspartic protease (TIGR02281 family)
MQRLSASMPEYPLDPKSNLILVNVSLAGRKGNPVFLTMALDTGASMTSIPSEAALSIGCDPTKSARKIEIITASGTEYVSIVTIPHLEIWEVKLKDIDVICLDMPPQSPVSGLLGLNVLKNFDVLLKFRSKILRINS